MKSKKKTFKSKFSAYQVDKRANDGVTRAGAGHRRSRRVRTNAARAAAEHARSMADDE